MKIGGLQKLTLLDFPEHIACTVFLSGCNLRCPFCHNALLVEGQAAEISENEFFDFLKSRQGLLDGVCVTGGEPTLQPTLLEFLQKIKDLGFSLKLDTNGTNVEVLESSLEIVDYVAMDIKNSPEKYSQTCGGIDVFAEVMKSVDLLMKDNTAYEFRTTVCHPLHTPEDMISIGKWIEGADKYYLQQFVDSGSLLGRGVSALKPTEVEALKGAVLPFVPNTYIRGL